MRLWWPRTPAPGNFGDIFTPWLYEKITGHRPQWHNHGKAGADTYCTGSIIRLAPPRATVWGSGIMRLADRVQPSLRILAVRGPRTRQIALASGAECPALYGDPALLLPRFYDKPKPITHEIGYIPHYVDLKEPPIPGTFVISPLQQIEPFVDQLRSCSRIISSSLHGLIAAHAYGIHWTHVLSKNPLSGDGIKFIDFLESIPLVDLDALLESCPFPPC